MSAAEEARKREAPARRPARGRGHRLAPPAFLLRASVLLAEPAGGWSNTGLLEDDAAPVAEEPAAIAAATAAAVLEAVAAEEAAAAVPAAERSA